MSGNWFDDMLAESDASYKAGRRVKAQRLGSKCAQSGRAWASIHDADRCPHCGRSLRRRADGTTPAHTVPSRLVGAG